MIARTSFVRKMFVAFGVVVAGLVLVPGNAPAATGAAIPPVKECADLKASYDIPGARTRVTDATSVPAGAEPAHCDVRGVIEPAVQFQLRLPTSTFTGRYVQYGCGGFCGAIFPPPQFPNCGMPNGGDAAVAATDDGHVGRQDPFPFFAFFDGTWAANNQAARDDWTFRAPHVLSLAAKRLIATYYGAPPRVSYFNGCSNGGREALLLAQRYPHDFDGIISAAPAAYISPLILYQAWIARANIGADGAQILTADKLPALHAAVIAACDRTDGLADEQIDDPRLCRFDPATVQCRPGTDGPDCLTPAQVEAANKLYGGPVDRGHRLYPGWQSRGSELAWNGWIIPAPPFPDSSAGLLADNYLRYMGYPIGTPHSSLADIRFTAREVHRLTPEGLRANALSLDLREFRRAGGKLILWHGWDDEGIPAVGTLDYYQRLWQRNGGLRQTQEWARLFMVPTMYHCGGGYKLTEFDPYRELVSWVERGVAPDRIVALGRDEQGTVVRTRPVFPYPLRAKYDGSGSVDDAANFVPARPLIPLGNDTIDWVGTYLHHIPGPVA